MEWLTTMWRGASTSDTESVFERFGWLLLLLALLAVFAPHLGNGFVYDDHVQIESNSFLEPGKSLTTPFIHDVWAGLEGSQEQRVQYYRPFFLLSYKVIAAVGGIAPAGFHVVALLLHGFIVFIVFFVARALNLTKAQSWVVAIAFAVNPLTAESVYWAGCLSDQMLAIASFGVILLFLVPWPVGTGQRGVLSLLVVILVALGLGSKETGVMMAPLASAILAFVWTRKREYSKLWCLGVIWGVEILYFFIRAHAVETSGLNWWSLIGQAPTKVVWDVGHLVFPFPQSIVHTLVGFQLNLATFWAFLLFAVGLAVVWRAFRADSRLTVMLVFWAAAMIAPTYAQLAFGRNTGVLVAERYLYHALLPWLVLLYLCLRDWRSRNPGRATRTVVVAVIVVWAVQTHVYGYVFKDDSSLFGHVVGVDPNSGVGLAWLGKVRVDEKRYEEAIVLLNRATEKEPMRAETWALLGSSYLQSRKYREAEAALTRSLELAPLMLGAHRLMGDLFRDQSRFGEAGEHYFEETRINPRDVAALSNLGGCQFVLGQFALAQESWSQALEIELGNPELLFNLGMLARKNGQNEEACTYFTRFLAGDSLDYQQQLSEVRSWVEGPGQCKLIQ